MSSTTEFKVRLVGKNSKIIFEASPSLRESRNANYDEWNLVHIPTDLFAYRNTKSRSWGIGATLISRTDMEAEENARILHTIRSWLLPDFAVSGAPPEILKLSAYGDPNIQNVTCVLLNYDWDYGNEVDYVFTTSHKMPIISTISISLREIYTAKEIQERKWEIKGIPSQRSNPLDFGPPSPEDMDLDWGPNPWDELGDLGPDYPEYLGGGSGGDLENLLENTTTPNLNDIVRDTFSGLPGPTGNDLITRTGEFANQEIDGFNQQVNQFDGLTGRNGLRWI